jgi:hypothetical protein
VDTQQHRVRRQVLEIQAPQEDIAGEIHRQLGRIQRQYLESIIDECCSEVSSPDRLHRIEKLELNLGSVSFAELEAELPKSLQTAMRQALREQVQALDQKAHPGDGYSAARSQLELVAFFSVNGALPWWADSRRPRQLPESIAFLLNQAPDELASLLGDILRQPEPSLRIVLHCDDHLLVQVFDVLTSPAASAAAVKQQIKVVFGEPWIKAKTGVSQVRNALWIAALTHASRATEWPSGPPPAGAGASPFWMIVFDSLATHSPEAFAAMLAAFLRHARAADGAVSYAVIPAAAALVEVGSRHGRIPEETLNKVADWLRATECSATNPQDRGSLLNAMGQRAAEIDDDRTRELEDPAQTAPRESQLDVNQSQAEPVQLRRFDDHGTTRAPRPLDLRFADTDSVFIENSGLVILWPFLELFFDRLQLLHERKFVDIAAQHRAAGLLQYMVTEDPSPPEYQMLLNKMLCGIDPNDLLDFGLAVTEEETQECVSLLSATIDNAPVLRKMSHEGFRGSFLLRKGTLSAGNGNWLLRVERETFDIVLDHFPWSFNWIKLPWMDVPLAVEW